MFPSAVLSLKLKIKKKKKELEEVTCASVSGWDHPGLQQEDLDAILSPNSTSTP